MPDNNMRRDFDSRRDLIDYLREMFPDAVARDPHITDTIGGRQAAEARLQRIKPGKPYAKTRNYTDGAVTRLSPYLRYGVLSLSEVRDHALTQVDSPEEAEKFLSEVTMRDYWNRIYREIGDSIWQNQEDYKTGFSHADYADELPEDIRTGQTGVQFIDDFCQELFRTGYLHNHVRMYLAAYVVHWRRIKWQAGARWFLTHLLDGDPASNNLSWQWIASTFSHKPYYYNLDNLRKYTKAYRDYTHPDFDDSYEAIAHKLFPNLENPSW